MSNEPFTTALLQTKDYRQTPKRSHQQKSLTGFLLPLHRLLLLLQTDRHQAPSRSHQQKSLTGFLLIEGDKVGGICRKYYRNSVVLPAKTLKAIEAHRSPTEPLWAPENVRAVYIWVHLGLGSHFIVFPASSVWRSGPEPKKIFKNL